jgi:hypothetical protein
LSTINEQRLELELNLEDSPSLKRVIPSELSGLYRKAATRASEELPKGVRLPQECPFTVDEILGNRLPE